MMFDINHPYIDAFRDDCMENGIWHGTTWEECFNGLGFSSYKFDSSTGNGLHYLSEDEFVIFALRYSA